MPELDWQEYARWPCNHCGSEPCACGGGDTESLELKLAVKDAIGRADRRFSWDEIEYLVLEALEEYRGEEREARR